MCMTDTGGTSTPAGWFTDPGGSGHLRWWDGSAWTAHLAPQPTPAPAPVPAPTPVVQQPEALAPVIMTPENEPYVPFQGSWNTSNQSSAYGEAAGFVRPMRWNTAGAWLLAFNVPLFVVAAFVIGFLGASAFAATGGTAATTGTTSGSLTPLTVGVQVGGWAIQLLFAWMDQRKLRSYGYMQTAAIWWVLLTPLAYLIARGIAVHRESGRGYGPLVAFSTFIGLAIVAAIALPAFLVARGASSSAQFAASLETGLDEKGGHYTVSCPANIPTAIGATFSCTAVDSSGTSHVLTIQIITGTNGEPSVKLVSVTPPIAG
jgi:hypothetical protein